MRHLKVMGYLVQNRDVGKDTGKCKYFVLYFKQGMNKIFVMMCSHKTVNMLHVSNERNQHNIHVTKTIIYFVV